jgi:hypothetical protein
LEIRPHRWGWKAFEAPGVEPVFPKKDQAIDHMGSGEEGQLPMSAKELRAGTFA